MKTRPLLKLFALATIILGISSCGPTHKEIVEIELTALGVGPFFSGPNSLMVDYEPNIIALVNDKDLKREDIKNINIQAVDLSIVPNSGFTMTDFSSASLQFVSDNQPMTSVAILNPIVTDGTKIELVASDEASVTELFQEDIITAIVDLDFVEDNFDENLEVSLKIKINIEY